MRAQGAKTMRWPGSVGAFHAVNETLSGLLDALAARDRARLLALAGVVVRHHAASRGVDLATHRTRRG